MEPLRKTHGGPPWKEVRKKLKGILMRILRKHQKEAMALVLLLAFFLVIIFVTSPPSQTTPPFSAAHRAHAGKEHLAFIPTPSSWHFTLTAVAFVAFGGVAISCYLCFTVLSLDEGTPDMQEVSHAIREGANGFLQQQYQTIFRFAVVIQVVLFFFYLSRSPPPSMGRDLTPVQLAIAVAFAFGVGASLSASAGYVGMWVSVRSNVRVSAAATRSYQEALKVGLRAGGFCGLLVVSMVLLGIIFLLIVVPLIATVDFVHLPFLLVGYGFGASFVALFAQLGGGIYTKAADVGGDMVGKVESNIPEDDPRNPATVADLVGDNVGDCAGRGSDLFESIAAEIIAAMILGSTLSSDMDDDARVGFILFPLGVHAMDLIISSVAIFSVRPGTAESDHPMSTLKAAYRIALGLGALGMVFLTSLMLSPRNAPGAWKYFAACGLLGIATAYAFIVVTEFYTDYAFAPVRRIANASRTGHGTNVIAGLAVGFESTAAPTLIVVCAIWFMYSLGHASGVAPAQLKSAGLYGTAVGCMGMLSTVAYVLAMDVFGPITDNAGGIVEMSEQPPYVRDITDKLDAVGNTTKAITKGFSVGSATLACFLLFTAFTDEVSELSGEPMKDINLANPPVFLSGLCGSMLVFYFSGLCMTAVGTCAQEVVRSVRQQFEMRPGILDRTQKPDYNLVVQLVTASAQREMIFPGLLAVLAPLVNGYIWRLAGGEDRLLGAKCTASFIMFATSTGVLMALFLNTAGGAWDNAKKFIESVVHGGKGSDAHKAAVTGDTVGDPSKDTAGPSLHVLIKLLATVTLVAAPLFVAPEPR
jgi:H(+)-translocating pyrophosphatase